MSTQCEHKNVRSENEGGAIYYVCKDCGHRVPSGSLAPMATNLRQAVAGFREGRWDITEVMDELPDRYGDALESIIEVMMMVAPDIHRDWFGEQLTEALSAIMTEALRNKDPRSAQRMHMTFEDVPR